MNEYGKEILGTCCRRNTHISTHMSGNALLKVIELQYADDCAIVAHDAEDLQNILDVFSSTYTAMGLRVNTLKSEIFVQTIHPPETPHLFLINGELVKTVEHFTYLGSVVHSDCSVDLDIQRRINLASSAFGRLRDRVFSNNNPRIDTKTAVYKAVCISTLLYGSEIWTTYRRHIRTLENFHTRCLQRIPGISWKDRMTYDELYHRTQKSSIETLLAQRHLHWVGHTIRMPENRLPRQMLYGQLSSGSRSVGGPKKRYKDHCKDLLINCNINPNELETLAVDRQTWRTVCTSGTNTLAIETSRKKAENRSKRHQRMAGAQPTPREEHLCHKCDKMCGSRIGLNSHLRWHERQSH
ncbi:uncharacterized protein LOC143033564 [Oratosquilla oratoria]|uniref:uncharacterized protein LOC143033564 n=1 Tax=Oratosquilla oratoria TaxID=337810 RepID=UPI003F772EF9